MKLYNITLNNLRRRIAKMLFVLVGLSIGIATITSVNGIVESMKYEMTRQVTEFGGNVVITPDSGGLTFSYGGIVLPEVLYDVQQLSNGDLTALDGLTNRGMIRAIAPRLMGFKKITGVHTQVLVVGADVKSEFTVKPWLRLAVPKDDAAAPAPPLEEPVVGEPGSGEKKMEFEELDLAREDLENLVLDDNQVIIGSTLASSLGLRSGDSLSLGGKEFKVYAILYPSGSDEDRQAIMNLNVAQELLERPEEITVIDLAVDYFSGSEEALLLEIKEVLPHTQLTSLRQEALRRDEMLTRLVRFGTTVSVLVLAVGMLVVGLTMAGAVRERTREIGVFRALGFRKIHIGQMIVLEGALISVVGGLMGFVLGTFIARLAGPLFAGMDILVPWRADLLTAALGLALAIGILSSLYPAYLAAKQDPVEALRFI